MEDDDLEYDITFPTPVPVDSAASDQDGFTGRREPVVILLGWLGCKEQYLSKYGQIYDNAGCITIRYTSPRDVAFFKVEQLRETACKVLDLLEDYSITENPIFFHIFSNNGSYVYSNIVDVLTSGEKRYQNLKVYGVIIDSAPGKARLTSAAKAYGTSLQANPLLKLVMVLGLLLYLFITAVVARWFPGYKRKSNHFLFENMAEDPTRWPMMFLYSTSDKVVLAKDVEDMIDCRRKLGVPVRSVCWDDTDHVSHLRKHPEQYIEACEEFLASCLGEYDTDGAGPMEQGTFETSDDYLLTKND